MSGWAKRLLSVRRWRCEALALQASRRAAISIGVVPLKKKSFGQKNLRFFYKIFFFGDVFSHLMINFA